MSIKADAVVNMVPQVFREAFRDPPHIITGEDD
jgi:hypothetical protein